MGVGTPEVREELSIFVETQEQLADDFDGENLGIEERRSGCAGSKAPEARDPIIDEAEDGHDEGAKIYEREDILFASVGVGPAERR